MTRSFCWRIMSRRNRTLSLLLYMALGINIAYHKGERGQRVTWIGVVFELDMEQEVMKDGL